MATRAADPYDLICLGSGPAGQKAAIQASKAGFRAAIIESEGQVGGACLLSGTIPSKALREQALRYRHLQRNASSLAVELNTAAPLSALLQGVDAVIAAQDRYLQAQLSRNGIDLIRARARLQGPDRVEVQRLDGTREVLRTRRILIATGSRPRHVAHLAVDHQYILDSDSILTLPYLPRTMIVIGSGVIACEYASTFAALGCRVTLLDKPGEPLGFLDPVLRRGFLRAFTAMGGTYHPGADVAGAAFDGVAQVRVTLRDGGVLEADVVLAAMGRVANLEDIGADQVNLTVNARGHLQVDEHYATNVAGIYAAGDVIGPPALACAAADQGRHAALAALDLNMAQALSLLPSGVYTIPEIGCIGLSESEATARNIDIVIGQADFAEVARAHIAGEPEGFLRLLCAQGSGRVLGVQALGEGAADLVHLGQAAIACGQSLNFFIDNMFNFPTMTEAYRIAAFDALKRLVRAD